MRKRQFLRGWTFVGSRLGIAGNNIWATLYQQVLEVAVLTGCLQHIVEQRMLRALIGGSRRAQASRPMIGLGYISLMRVGARHCGVNGAGGG